VLPALEEFAPDLILVSAGFDAHARDPLANLRLEAEDFGWITGKLVDLAGEYCDGRLVSTLEGGYDLVALAESATAHVTELMRG
jgi:acetoin utilization deacetylase AcuC-like enzyme